MRSVRQVARVLSRQPAPPVRLRQGVITDINSDRTVDLTLGGVELTNVPCLTSAVPRVSSAVMVVISGRDMFVLGSIADDSALGYTPLMQRGSVTVSVAASDTAATAVVFDWVFPDTPDVFVSCRRGASNKAYAPNTGSVTSTGFNARVTTTDGSSQTEDITVKWVAMQVGE